MEKNVYAVDGRVVKQVTLEEGVFLPEFNQDVVYYAVNHELANSRLGTAHTKTRGEVRGSNKKPWKQKHTGRARSGDVKSPLWTGGGVIFGPRKRSYSFALPKKVKRLAIRSVLGLQARKDSFKIVEDFPFPSGKTRDLYNLLAVFFEKRSLQAESAGSHVSSRSRAKYPKTLILLKDEDTLLKRAARNIPWLRFLSYKRLRVHDVLYSTNFFVLESALVKLQENYGSLK